MKNVQKNGPSLMLIITLVGFPQISESIFTPVLPALSRALRVSASQVQLTMSSYFVAFAIGVLFWGQLADLVGRRPAMLAGIAVYLLGNIGLFASANFGWLIGWRCVQAFGASAGSVVTQTIMRESFSGMAGAKIFAQTSAAMALAPALGPLIGGLVQAWFGYRQVFSTLIGMAGLILLYSGWRLPETRPIGMTAGTTASTPVTLKRLARDPVVWEYGFLIGGINGILFSYYAEAPFIFETHFGFSTVQYGLLGLILAMASLVAALLVTQLLTTHRPEQLILAGFSLSTVAAVGLLLAAQFDQVVWLLVSIFMTFLGLNIALPNCLNRALIGYEAIMGRASGWFSLAYYLVVSGLTYLMSCLHNGTILRLPAYIIVLSSLMLTSYFLVQRHYLKN